jgi:hypothetical protein
MLKQSSYISHHILCNPHKNTRCTFTLDIIVLYIYLTLPTGTYTCFFFQFCPDTFSNPTNYGENIGKTFQNGNYTHLTPVIILQVLHFTSSHVTLNLTQCYKHHPEFFIPKLSTQTCVKTHTSNYHPMYNLITHYEFIQLLSQQTHKNTYKKPPMSSNFYHSQEAKHDITFL